MTPLLSEFVHNFTHNLFKPLLLFFYMGFLIPILRVSFEFPYVIYQGLTMYLLISIGWHGGEELASLPLSSIQEALGFMAIGFFTNLLIGIVAYYGLRIMTDLRKVDAATVAGYYGSDSAGTFVTCVGVLTSAGIAFRAYMPVMLAVMEIPGCLVALYLVSRLRKKGLDVEGNAWDEPGYNESSIATINHRHHGANRQAHVATKIGQTRRANMAHAAADGFNDSHDHSSTAVAEAPKAASIRRNVVAPKSSGGDSNRQNDLELEAELALEKIEGEVAKAGHPPRGSMFNKELLHEVFFNPGIYLLFGGIAIGFISRLQGEKVTAPDDSLFVSLFQGVLCLFLLEMGITASKRLQDLRRAGWKFIFFALLAPNVFATVGITVAHLYSMALGVPFELGTYVLFGVLCGAASYIAVPAVQRLAIPEASPTLPLAASLGVTFSYNVTVGIPVYILLARVVTTHFPVAA